MFVNAFPLRLSDYLLFGSFLLEVSLESRRFSCMRNFKDVPRNVFGFILCWMDLTELGRTLVIAWGTVKIERLFDIWDFGEHPFCEVLRTFAISCNTVAASDRFDLPFRATVDVSWWALVNMNLIEVRHVASPKQADLGIFDHAFGTGWPWNALRLTFSAWTVTVLDLAEAVFWVQIWSRIWKQKDVLGVVSCVCNGDHFAHTVTYLIN